MVDGSIWETRINEERRSRRGETGKDLESYWATDRVTM